MRHDNLVSIIVAAYNEESHIRDCIDSLLAQTYQNVEIIVVNDGSTDSTADILLHYGKKITVVNLSNSGLSAARNAGMDIAQGEWIVFVDGDDMLHQDCISLMLMAAYRYNAEIVSAKFTRKLPFNTVSSVFDSSAFSSDDAIENTLYQRTISNSVCGKVFKREVLAGLRFRDGLWYEDLELFPRVLERCNKLLHIDCKLYFYRINPASFINNFTARRLDVLKVTDEIEERYSNSTRLLKAAHDRRFAANFNMFVLASKAGNPASKDCWTAVKSLRKEILLNPKSRLKNKIGALLSFFGPTTSMFISNFVYK